MRHSSVPLHQYSTKTCAKTTTFRSNSHDPHTCNPKTTPCCVSHYARRYRSALPLLVVRSLSLRLFVCFLTGPSLGNPFNVWAFCAQPCIRHDACQFQCLSISRCLCSCASFCTMSNSSVLRQSCSNSTCLAKLSSTSIFCSE